ncbi:hypothetical protein [Marinobacter sp. JSM 1782161]|uniref:hypothetical protein n=1 Tax=Marinobacter sp. JSM 1782161 TaxID=2685906 RepID=UPI0014033F0B|nr:hypothetical protein [Marinobacter sp. JSM 1782161]
MPRAVCQQVLDRLIAYLRGCGVGMTSEDCCKALSLVERALREDPDGKVMERAMNLLPEYFDIPDATIPRQAPPLLRGSIGYSPYV